MLDLDAVTVRGQSFRHALATLRSASVRTASGCLVGPHGANRYHELRAGGRRKLAHIVVALERGDAIGRDEVVRHSCDTPGCIESDHLQVGTQSRNIAESYERHRRDGDWAHGEQRPNAVLTEDLVAELRRRHRRGDSLTDLASDAGIPYSRLRSAIRGDTWRHVTTEAPVAGRRNAKPNPRAIRLTHLDEAREALRRFDLGDSLSEIATALNISRHTAWNYCRVARQEIR